MMSSHQIIVGGVGVGELVFRFSGPHLRGKLMSSDRILLVLIVVVSILAAIPQIASAFAMWGLVLVLLGLIAGFMGGYGSDMTQRILIYVAAAFIGGIANSLDNIMVVGPWLNAVIDNMQVGIRGIAVAVFMLAMYERIMPAQQSGGYHP